MLKSSRHGMLSSLFFTSVPKSDRDRRSVASPRQYRPSKYDGETLRAIRAEKGVGRRRGTRRGNCNLLPESAAP